MEVGAGTGAGAEMGTIGAEAGDRMGKGTRAKA